MSKSWEDLENRLSNTLFELVVSLSGIKSLDQVIQYAESALTEINNQINKIGGLDKACLYKKYLKYLDIYVSYIISLKSSQDSIYRANYSRKANQLYSQVESVLASLKSDFKEATDEAKIIFGDCLIDANLVKLKLSKELFQRPSVDYRSILRDITNVLSMIKEQSREFLNELYISSDGNPDSKREINKISDTLGFDKSTTENIIKFLQEKGLIEQDSINSNIINITIEGGIMISNDSFENDINVNIMNIEGDVISSQLQQSSPGAVQTININPNKFDGLRKVIEEIKSSKDKLDLNEEQISEFDPALITIDAHLSSLRPNPKVINENLFSIRRILESLTGSTIAQALLSQIDNLL